MWNGGIADCECRIAGEMIAAAVRAGHLTQTCRQPHSTLEFPGQPMLLVMSLKIT